MAELDQPLHQRGGDPLAPVRRSHSQLIEEHFGEGLVRMQQLDRGDEPSGLVAHVADEEVVALIGEECVSRATVKRMVEEGRGWKDLISRNGDLNAKSLRLVAHARSIGPDSGSVASP